MGWVAKRFRLAEEEGRFGGDGRTRTWSADHNRPRKRQNPLFNFDLGVACEACDSRARTRDISRW